MYNGGAVFLAGSAHLDVLARVTGDEFAVDKIGRVSIEIGGTACNIATDMASLGLHPRLMTVLQDKSPYTAIIKAHLQSHGVEVRAVSRDDLQPAVFSAHIGLDGEMLSAVSCMPLDSVQFADEEVESAMRGATCAVLECNLAGSSLRQFARIAHSLSIPVFVAAVSEEKSIRIAEIDSPLAGVFMNKREAAYFGKRVAASVSPVTISEKLDAPLVVTMGKGGAVVVQDMDEFRIEPQQAPENAQTLGAGDALLAASVAHHVFGGLDLVSAVERSVPFATSVIGKDNCNVGHGKAVENALSVLDNMAFKDTLTGLANRRAAEQVLDRAFANRSNGSRFSVLLLDIDRFKLVNDTHGHDVGDEAIKMVAAVLAQTVRGHDVAARWGGEEFLCVLSDLDAGTALQVAERIRASVEAAVIPIVGKITISIGVCSYAGHKSAKEMAKQSDEALYRAKQNGRNRVEMAGVAAAAATLEMQT